MQRPPRFETPERIVLPGKSETIKTVGGNFWFILRANHPRFRVKINEDDWTQAGVAEGDVYPDGFNIEQIEVRNDDPSVPLKIVIKTGKGAPIANGLYLYQDEVVPSLRADSPSSAEFVPFTCTAGVWKRIALADQLRANAFLFSGVNQIFWAPTGDAGNPTGAFNDLSQVGGLTQLFEYRNKSEIWVKAATALSGVLIVHKYA